MLTISQDRRWFTLSGVLVALMFSQVSSALAALPTIPVGAGPTGVAVNAETNRVYVSNSLSNAVSVIDGTSNTVIATIAVGLNPGPIEVNPRTNRVYVANRSANTVSVIDGVTNSIVGTITLFGNPDGVVVNPLTNRLYVVADGFLVQVIDTITNAPISFFGLFGVGTAAAINPQTNRLYVTREFSSDLAVIVLFDDSGFVTQSVPTGFGPSGVAVNTQTNRIYVANRFSNRVTVLDGISNSIVALIDVGSEPRSVAVNPETNQVYVTNSRSNSVSVINGATNQVVDTIEVASVPLGVAVNSKTNLVYVANNDANSVSVIGTPPALPVQIDIKPGSFPNSINPKSHGTIPVAILSTAGFNAPAAVDTVSLTFGRTGDEVSLAFCSPSPEDVNGDGLLDLVCHFGAQLTGFQLGDTIGVLKGQTVEGTPIIGTDSVRTVPLD